ncbi:MAG: DUF86 domain-containing protein [Desulfobacterales bacterium]
MPIKQLPFERLSEAKITNNSTQEQKIALFRSLFRGREDVYPRRFESKLTGKSGFQPVCRNEWIRPICQKPKIKCGDCENRDLIPLSDGVIRNHLNGIDPTDPYRREFVIGVYPMLVDETCWFLAVDFDKEAWKENSKAYLETCRPVDVIRYRNEMNRYLLDKITDDSLLPNYPQIDWKKVKGIRDIISHHYFDIDAEAIFIVCNDHIEQLAEAIKKIMKDVRENQNR